MSDFADTDTQAFWIGGVRNNSVWRWTDGSKMQMGPPFWGKVCVQKIVNSTNDLFLYYELS